MKIAKFLTDEERQRIETAQKQLFALAADVIQQGDEEKLSRYLKQAAEQGLLQREVSEACSVRSGCRSQSRDHSILFNSKVGFKEEAERYADGFRPAKEETGLRQYRKDNLRCLERHCLPR